MCVATPDGLGHCALPYRWEAGDHDKRGGRHHIMHHTMSTGLAQQVQRVCHKWLQPAVLPAAARPTQVLVH